MNFIKKHGSLSCFIYLSLITLSIEGVAVTGSITNPALSEESVDLESFYGSIKTEFTRNTRISADQFIHPNRKDGLFDKLYLRNDLILSAPLTTYFSALENSDFFNNINTVFILNYQRPLYASVQEVNSICWGSVMCFGDIDLGFSKPVLKTNRAFLESSFYLVIPFSRASFDQSLLMGLRASLEGRYKLLSRSHFSLSFISSGYLDFDYYIYETANADKTVYNIPLNTFGQVGLKMLYSKYSFVPVLFFYSSYSFALDFKGSPYHRLSLNMSAAWSVNKKINIIAGISWGDRILKPKNSYAIDTVVFDPDRTFMNVGASYSF